MPKVTNALMLDLVGRGMQSDLADRIAQRVPDLPSLAKTTSAVFRTFLTDAEIEVVFRTLKRKEIPAATISKLVQECDWKCCLCWNVDREAPVIIHHIEEHSKTFDDSFENLVLLCANHHAEAHSKWEISRSPCPPELIKVRKSEWIKAIAEFRAGLRAAPGRETHWLADLRPTPPPPADHFVGRALELDEIANSIISSQTNQIALVGMAGVGKTTLALKLAEHCSMHFGGGVFWADLSDGNGDILPILRLWLECCGGPGNYPTDKKSAVLALRSLLSKHVTVKGPALFVIDDAREAWTSTARELLEIFPRNASVVITTRDTTVPVSLGLSTKAVIPLLPEAALELLRMTAVSPVVDSEPAITARLIELLGGLPLALKLVGKQIALISSKPGYSLETLCHRIETFAQDSLSFPGHRGLIASFALSYENLDTDEKDAFRWLGIFAPGPLRLTNIAKVTQKAAGDAERTLDRMVLVSILNWGAERGIYRIHPLLHQYAAHLLGKSSHTPEFLQAQTAHFDYYAKLVATISKDRPDSHDELQAEFPNILLAIDGAHANAEWELISDVVFGLWSDTDFLSMRGYERQAVGLLEKAIFASRQRQDFKMEAAHLGHLGAAKTRLGLLSEAKECIDQACSVAEKSGDGYDVPAFLQNLGVVLLDMGKSGEALDVLQKALRLAEVEHNLPVALDILGSLGNIHLRRGDFLRAGHFYKNALTLCKIAGNRLGEGNNLSNLGLVLLETGAIEEGERCITKALEIARAIGDKHGQENRLGHLGGIWLKRSTKAKNMADHIFCLGQARKFTEQALKITREVGDRIHEGCWLGDLAYCYWVGGEAPKAALYFLQAIEIARETGHRESEGRCLVNLGMLERDQGNFAGARMRMSEALIILQSIGSHHATYAKAQLKSLDEATKKKVL